MSNISKRITALSPEKRALLLQRLQAQEAATERVAATLPSIEPDVEGRDQPFPLLTIQEVYLLGRSGIFDLGKHGANTYIEYEISGVSSLVQPFILRAIETALNRLIKRHDILRLIILPDGRQQVLPQVARFRLKVVNLRRTSPEIVAVALDKTREHLRLRKAPLDRWPLFEVVAHQLDGRILLHFRFESMLMDGLSRSKLMEELIRLVENPNMSLAPIPCSFRDFAVAWHTFQTIDNDHNVLYRRARDYWLQRVPALPPPPELPLAAYVTPNIPTRFVTWISEVLEASAWTRLKARAARVGISPSGVGTAAFIEMLKQWNVVPDFTLSMESTYRPLVHPQIAELIANFNTIHLLAVPNTPGTFEARAQRVQQQIMSDLERRNFSGHEVLREWNRRLQGGARSATFLLFNSIIEYSHTSYRSRHEDDTEEDAKLTPPSPPPAGLHAVRAQLNRASQYAVRRLLDVYQQKAPTQPGFEVIEANMYAPQILMLPSLIEDRDGNLRCRWHVVEEAFPPGLVRDLADVFADFLRRLAAEETAWQATTPHIFVPKAQLEQRRQINNTQLPLPAETLYSLFMTQVAERPRQAALIADNARMTYSALADTTSFLASELRSLGIQANTLVAIVMEHGWEVVVATLAVAAAGAAFVPIDPTLPEEQFRALFEHSQASVALTQSKLDADLPWPEGVRRLQVDRLPPNREAQPSTSQPRPQDLAYVIHTSTSTERPTAVMIDHQSAVNTIFDINQRFHVNEHDRVLALTPITSDLSIYDIFGTLAAGGMIVLPDCRALRDPGYLAELVAREHVTIWNSPPAVLQQWIAYLADAPSERPLHSLRLALLSRDRVPVCLAEQLRAVAPNVMAVSLGGATETAIWSSVYGIQASHPSCTGMPYGQPLTNQHLHVLDHELLPRPTWVPGHLYIGGIGVARGYWRNPEQTREAFITDPTTGQRLYRTGEWARYLPDGTIELLGQNDFQVKIRGYTVEPRRIEAALEQHPALYQAIVQGHTDDSGYTHLVAYVVPQPHKGPSLGEIRGFLARNFPDYMLPVQLHLLETLPLMATGQIDRRALPKPQLPPSQQQHTFVAPRNALELHVLRIWEELLETRPLGVTDNFFEVGGNSLLVARLITRIRELFDQDIALLTFLMEPRVEHLARIIHAARTAKAAALAASKQAAALASKERSVAQSTATGVQTITPNMRTFFLIWFGQMISQIGTGLTGFALGVWVFEMNRSPTQFTLIAFFTALPLVLCSPIAGALVDRWDRKWSMILSDAGAAIGTMLMMVLLVVDNLQLWHIYLIVAASSIFRSLQYPAYSAATTLLVPKEQLARASGLVQLSQGIGQLVSPILAGFLVGMVGLHGVMAIDLITFCFAIGTLLLARVPRPAISHDGQQGRGSLAYESMYGWKYIMARPGLLGLLLFFIVSNFLTGVIVVMATPLVLSFSDAAALGIVLSVAGLGMVAGSILMSITGGFKRRVHGVFSGVLLMGVCMVIAGLRPSVVLLAASAFVFTAGLPIIIASSQAIWQRKVAPDVQGRVFAIRSMIATSSTPLAYLLAGPLADYVFEPLVRENGVLATSVGRIIGVGPGRGIGLMFIVLGILGVISVVAGYLSPRLRLVEDELPDAIVDVPPAADGPPTAKDQPGAEPMSYPPAREQLRS